MIAPIPGITEREFALFRELIQREAGIHLSEAKKALLVGRLARRLRELGLASFSAYHQRVVEGEDGQELVCLLDAVSTNETHFFREPRHFELLAQEVFPAWRAEADAHRRSRQVRAWSAACSSGEEPYSLAMVMQEHLPPSAGWQLEVLASDLSTRVLDRARVAIWPREKEKEIPPGYLKRFMLQGTRSQEGKMKAGPELRAVTRFQRVNLNDERYPVVGSFDLVFCRNVLIYFDAALKLRVIRRLLDHLAPGGLLFLGHAESLSGMTELLRSIIPTVYVRASESPPAWGAVRRSA